MEVIPRTKLTVVWNEAKELYHLTDFLENVWKEWLLAPALFPPVNQAITTLFLTIIAHAFDDKETHMIGIEITLENGRLIFVMKDGGLPFNPLSLNEKPGETPAGTDTPMPVELSVVRQTMDLISYERKNGKNVLTMIKQLPAFHD